MGTLKIVRLAESAGLTRPEFEEQTGSLVVRFLPTAYVPPRRVDHDLSELQRDLLAALARLGEASLSQILATLPVAVAARTAQENLSMLRGFGLVDSSGRGRGAYWRLQR